MLPLEVLALMLAAAAGGAINAVAGGGTLITFPTLLFFGVSPVIANATSTLALVIGTSGSIYGYRGHLESVKPWLWRFVPVSVLGGWVGSVLLTRTSDAVFARLVPFLILFATLLFFSQGLVNRWLGLEGAPPHPHKRHAVASVLFQTAVAVYGGYFGAGIGILMLAAFGLLGLSDIHQMNTVKTILGSLINLIAALWFVWAGLIDWPRAAVLTIGALAGYFLGSHFSQRISQARVRQIIAFIGLGLALLTFYQQFLA